jgi:hypothetical protein
MDRERADGDRAVAANRRLRKDVKELKKAGKLG